MTAPELMTAASVSLIAGALNSIAGGGSLILFPTLVALGLPTVAANVTNSVTQWPGYLGAVAGSRQHYRGHRSRLLVLSTVAALGGVTGSVLLLNTPSSAFDVVVPVLVLLAGILIGVQPLLTRRLAARDPATGRDPAWLYPLVALACVYGGYFGGALGVILTAVLTLGTGQLHLSNAIKNLLSLATATTTVAVFGLFGPVQWTLVAVCAPAALLGGFLGARVATRIPSGGLRVFVVVFSIAVAGYLLVRA